MQCLYPIVAVVKISKILAFLVKLPIGCPDPEAIELDIPRTVTQSSENFCLCFPSLISSSSLSSARLTKV